jgi:hypothetical protein
MRKTIVLAAMLFSSSAYAEDWVGIDQINGSGYHNEDTDYYYLDTDSFTKDLMDGNDNDQYHVNVQLAHMREDTLQFTVIRKDCIHGSGIMYHSMSDENIPFNLRKSGLDNSLARVLCNWGIHTHG